VGPRAGLETAVARREIPFPYREWNPGCPARSLVTLLTELPSSLHICRKWQNHHVKCILLPKSRIHVLLCKSGTGTGTGTGT
jgi:hypothetical protein